MSQLSVNYRATWRPPPHDRKSIKAGGRGEAALFHLFCPERGLQKGENCSQEMKTVGKQITKRSESYSILMRKCSNSTLRHFFSPPQYPVGQEDLF